MRSWFYNGQELVLVGGANGIPTEGYSEEATLSRVAHDIGDDLGAWAAERLRHQGEAVFVQLSRVRAQIDCK
jgi:hypothetical protein